MDIHRWAVLAAVAGCCATGCGDSRAGGSGSSEIPPAWRTYCEETAPARATMCDEFWDEDETSRCLDRAACSKTSFREDLFSLVPDCLGSRDCATIDDVCYYPEGLGATSSAAAAAHRETCLAKRDECLTEGDAFIDDYCFVGILSDDVVESLTACLEEPCANVTECFAAVHPYC